MIQIGEFNVHEILHGYFALDGGAMFGVVPKTIWSKMTPVDELNRIDMALRSILIEYRDRLILVDTGIGEKWAEKYKSIYKIDTDRVNTSISLKSLGFSKTDITDVILTHLHFDHTGGSTINDNGVLMPAFENATYYVGERNWQWAHHPTEKDRASYLIENFAPLERENVLRLVTRLDDIGIPGLSSFESDGHTTGMLLPILSGDSNKLMYCADLIPTSLHISLPFVMGYDNEPLKTLAEKKKVLVQAVSESWTLVYEHDFNHTASTVRVDEKGKYVVNDYVKL